MEDKTRELVEIIESTVDIFCAIREDSVDSLTMIDMFLTFAIMCNKLAGKSWGDFQKDFVTLYGEMSDNQEEELIPSRYSVLMFDSTVHNEQYFILMDKINSTIQEHSNDACNLEYLRSSFLILTVKMCDSIKAGLTRIMELAFRKYDLIFDIDLNVKDTSSSDCLFDRCLQFISESQSHLKDIKRRVATHDIEVNKIKEEILVSLDLCGPGVILDKFFVTRAISAILAKYAGLEFYEFLRLCSEAYNEEKDPQCEELPDSEFLKFNKQDPDYIFLKDTTLLISNVFKTYYNKNNSFFVMNFIKALLKASMCVANEAGESKFRMIDSITTYFSNSSAIADPFGAFDGLIIHFSEQITKNSKVNTNNDSINLDEEIKINSNWFVIDKGPKLLN